MSRIFYNRFVQTPIFRYYMYMRYLASITIPRLLVAGLLVILVWLATMQYRQWQQERAIDRQIQSLESQQRTIISQNEELANSLRYFTTDAYAEQVAKTELNQKRDGEMVIQFGGAVDAAKTAPEAFDDSTPSGMKNVLAWWTYFFKTH